MYKTNSQASAAIGGGNVTPGAFFGDVNGNQVTPTATGGGIFNSD